MAAKSAFLGVMTACLSIAVCALLVEGVCQAYAAYMKRGWDRVRQSEHHYYVRSELPGLAYEIAPNRNIINSGRVLVTNRFGLRERTDSLGLAHYCMIALLGDSIVFGSDVSQDETIDAFMEQRLTDERKQIEVINLGTPGYGIEELHQYLGRAVIRFRFDLIVYVLNLNDFAQRDSVYEGADNGLYRMYRMPTFKSPWFARKAIYRMKKGHTFASPTWLRWMFNGNKEHFLALIADMQRTVAEREGRFTVVLLPAGSAYQHDGYELQSIHDEISSYLRARSVTVLDLAPVFQTTAKQHFDATDHLTVDGDAAIAAQVEKFIRPILAGSKTPSCRMISESASTGLVSVPSRYRLAGMNQWRFREQRYAGTN